MSTFHVLRYSSQVPLNKRHHVHTLGRYASWADAEDARMSMPSEVANLLDVVEREVAP